MASRKEKAVRHTSLTTPVRVRAKAANSPKGPVAKRVASVQRSRAPVGLTANHYTDNTVLLREQTQIVSKGWIALCREDDVSAPGAFFATTLLDEPVVVVRGNDSCVRVLSNVCRHRGMMLTTGCGVASRLTCPYHAWTYELDGRLRGAPQMREQVAGRHCDLPVINAWCWGGFVFANPDTKAKPPNLAKLSLQIGNYGLDQYHGIESFEEVWSCNWKCLVENFMDAYHLSVVHPETLRPLTPSHLSRQSVKGKSFTSYIAHYTKTAPPRRHHAPALTEEERRQSQLFCIYPFLVVSVSADTAAYLMLQPVGVDAVRVRWGVSSFEARLSKSAGRARVKKWQAINAEDHAILERLQEGLRSKIYKPGPLAPPDLEGSVADFHTWYRGALKR